MVGWSEKPSRETARCARGSVRGQRGASMTFSNQAQAFPLSAAANLKSDARFYSSEKVRRTSAMQFREMTGRHVFAVMPCRPAAEITIMTVPGGSRAKCGRRDRFPALLLEQRRRLFRMNEREIFAAALLGTGLDQRRDFPGLQRWLHGDHFCREVRHIGRGH